MILYTFFLSLLSLINISSEGKLLKDIIRYYFVLFQIQELEREILKLRSTLETQQDAALERLNTKEQEWKVKLQEERDKVRLKFLEHTLENTQDSCMNYFNNLSYKYCPRKNLFIYS